MKPIAVYIRDLLNSGSIQLDENKDWNGLLESEGYFCVIVNSERYDRLELRDMVDWIKERSGPDHCYWTGGRFWFDREEDAVIFALRWV